MTILPKIEKVTRDVMISHFLLMFGYKLFSLYFPLFLVAKGMALPEVGYTYLLIYLPIALSSPLVGFLNHKINPAILASLGILGYAFYVVGMILIQVSGLFYFWQVLLGVSAALFFVSTRAILMSASLESYDRAFGWFYSAPFYAEAIAPAVGALFIWKFDFLGVFIFSLILQLFTAAFFFYQLGRKQIKPIDRYFNFQKFSQNYQVAFQKLTKHLTFPFILISFSILFVNGFYHAFFLLFLKNILGWSQNLVLFFGALSSFLFLPVSLFVINLIAKQRSERNIFQGGLIYSVFPIFLGILLPFLNFLNVLFIELGRGFGSLMAGSGRSALIRQSLKNTSEEAGAIDTIFSPLGVALGALISGLVIGFLGYQLLFILGGILVILVGFLSKRFAKF